jgi:hypothetical protein
VIERKSRREHPREEEVRLSRSSSSAEEGDGGEVGDGREMGTGGEYQGRRRAATFHLSAIAREP